MVTDTLAVVAPGTGVRTLRALARADVSRVVIEDPAALVEVKTIVTGRCDVLSDFVPRVRDGYHPAVRSQTAELLRLLPLALGATAWSYGEVSVWEPWPRTLTGSSSTACFRQPILPRICWTPCLRSAS